MTDEQKLAAIETRLAQTIEARMNAMDKRLDFILNFIIVVTILIGIYFMASSFIMYHQQKQIEAIQAYSEKVGERVGVKEREVKQPQQPKFAVIIVE